MGSLMFWHRPVVLEEVALALLSRYRAFFLLIQSMGSYGEVGGSEAEGELGDLESEGRDGKPV